jgi:hypothetical protein
LIALQKKIDGQSIANMDDVPWYSKIPSEPTPIPVLGPDVIDPRQMDLIRKQAELAAAGKPFGVRELPAVESVEKPAPVVEEKSAPAAEETVDPAKAERMRKREEALARKRAREAAADPEAGG